MKRKHLPLRPGRWLGAVALAACISTASWGGPPGWPDAPYSYYAENVQLESVLREFANSFSLSLAMDPGITGTVNGRFTSKNPTEFISRLGGVYGFTWYTHGGVLYVSRTSEAVMKAVPLPLGGYNLRAALLELGVLEPRFGWAELPSQRTVMVSGPATYIALIEQTLKQLPGAASLQEVRLFRLRYASADDRVIAYRGGSVVQPGLGSVLQRLIGGRGAILAGFPEDSSGATIGAAPVAPTLSAAAGPAGTQPAVGAGGALAGAAPASPAPGSAAGSTTPAASPGAERSGGSSALQISADPNKGRVPSIQTDPRLNALIIQDQPERMPVYEKLIAQLDVPSPLIEIEAMIIDVNSDRTRELGINWSLRGNSASLDFGTPGTFSGSGTLSFTGAASALGLNSSVQLLTQIRALETKGDARIQSRPSVLTIDNIGALLDLSETFYIRVLGERVANVSPITAGTTLRVTPRLIDGANPSIQLTIDIEDGAIQDRQIDALPTVRRSTVSTQAIVKQDETLVIAGYSSDQNVDADLKVPVLGDIPGLGVLFSNKQRSVQRRERIFMIKPRLVAMPGTTIPAPGGPMLPAEPVQPPKS